MNKKFFAAFIAVVFSTFIGYNIYRTQCNKIQLSDLMLANVEALAEGEDFKDGQQISCFMFIVSPTPSELLGGPGSYPIVFSCSPCGNLVIAKQASGSSICTYYKS